MRTGPFLAATLAATLAAGSAVAAVPAAAARDSSLGGFLRQFSDSTDRYFGISAAPVDTAGLDTVLFDSARRPPRRLHIALAPGFRFDRVDGSTPGLSATLRGPDPDPDRSGWGRLRGEISRATGPGVTLGGLRYTNRIWLARRPLDLELQGGRRTDCMDRDDGEGTLTLARALLWGSDWTQYLRSDGLRGSIACGRGGWRLAAGFRDELQSPLRTTTTWNLAGAALEMPSNLAATRGRTHELEYVAALRWPRLPLRAEIAYQISSRRLGSDFEYRRIRAAAGLDLSLGRLATLVPQFAYGRLTGEPLPQAAFYLGGGTMRSLRRDERGGTGMALAKLDLIGARDLLALLRVPHPAALPLQGALFTATGATWGRDPHGGAITAERGWPDRRGWRSEAGVALLYNSALFPEGAALRCSYAWPLGPDAGGGRWSVSVTRPLDLLGPAREE